MFVDSETIRFLWPELILVLCAAWIYLGGTFRGSRRWWVAFALAAYLLALGVILGLEGPATTSGDRGGLASGPILVDQLGMICRCFAILVGILLTLLMSKSTRHDLGSEYQGTLMLLVVGLMLVARANDLVLLFVSLELISVPTYVLLFLGRRDRGTSEATLKYFLLSILSSAMLLYGMSFLYGLTGTTSLRGIQAAVSTQPSVAALSFASLGISPDALIYLSLVFLVAGLGFRLAAVPFHFYAPDVFQGVTHANAALLSVVPKVAGLLAFTRLVILGFPQAASQAWEILLVLSILTMTLGNVCALWQQNLRRLLAYSSIAHAGYILIGITVALADSQRAGDSQGGVAAALVYVVVYAVAALGSFAVLAYLGSEQNEVHGVDELAGLARTRPFAATALSICMFSLAGLPPLAGFWGKLVLFLGAVQTSSGGLTVQVMQWFMILAIAGAINAAIGAAYYLRVIATMFFRAPAKTLDAEGGDGAAVVMLVCASLVVAIGLFPGIALNLARKAEASLRAPVSLAAQDPDRSQPRPVEHAWHAPEPPRTNL